MKVCVLMFYDDAIKDYAEINHKINKKYCDKHNIDLIVSGEKKHTTRHPAWERYPLILDNIRNYNYVIWIDADAFFYHDSNNITDIIYDNIDKNFIFSKDKTDNINTGVMIIKNTNYSIDFINILAHDHELYNKNSMPEWWDQGVLNDMYEKNVLNIKENSVILDFGVLQHFKEHDISKNKKPYILHGAGMSKDERINTSKKHHEFVREGFDTIWNWNHYLFLFIIVCIILSFILTINRFDFLFQKFKKIIMSTTPKK
jgi:hypothetical protein